MEMNNSFIYTLNNRETGSTTSIRNERIEDEFGVSIRTSLSQRNLNDIDSTSLPVSHLITHDSNNISYRLSNNQSVDPENTDTDNEPLRETVDTDIEPQPSAQDSHHRRQTSIEIELPLSHTSQQEEPGPIGSSVRQIQIQPPRNSTAISAAMSENEKFHDVLCKASRIFSMLAEPWVSSTPSIRLTQISYDTRAFALMTAIKSSIHRSERGKESESPPFRTPYAAVLWQTAKKPPKAVCITMYYTRPLDETSPIFTVVCSCNPSIHVQRSSNLSCEHIKSILTENPTVALYKDILWTQINSAEITRYFGEESFIGDSLSTVCLDIHEANNNSILNYNHHNHVRGVLPWSFFVQFDVDRSLFVPLKKYSHRRIECLFCRGHRNRRGACIHETTWEAAVYGPDSEEYNEDSVSFELEGRENLLDENYDDNDDGESNQPENNLKTDPTEKYSPTNLKLPLLPCSAIDEKMTKLASQIKKVKGKTLLQIQDKYAICPHCKYERDDNPLDESLSSFRKTKLYTISQQIPNILVEDWKCPSCLRLVYFTGIGTALFPTRKRFTYTYELLYYYLHNVCRLGISFRAQYESYHMTQISASANAIFDDYCGPGAPLQQDIDDCRSGRRRASEAFRLFISCIDTSNRQLCEQLFSCKDCEVPLTTVDKALLGLQESQVSPEDKRFKALVIDGTTAGILHQLPKFDRKPILLSVSSELRKKQRIVTNQLMHSTLTLLFKLLQSRIRTIMNRRLNISVSSAFLSFRLPLQRNSECCSNKQQFSMQQLACLRVILSNECCVCDSFRIREGSPRALHNTNCSKANKIFTEMFSDSETIRLLQAVFKLELREVGNDIRDNNQHLDQLGSTNSSDSDESSILDICSSDEESSVDGEGDIQEDQEDVLHKSWYISFTIPKARKCSQVIESYVDVLKFMFFDNVMLPYIRPPSSILNHQVGHSSSEYITERREKLFDSDGSLKLKSDVIGYDALQAHDQFCSALEQFADCAHVSYNSHPCSSCTQQLARESSKINEINPIFSRLVDQILLHSTYIGFKIRMLIDELANAFREHMAMAEFCFNNITDNLAPECKDYWLKYSGNSLNPLLSNQHSRNYETINHGHEGSNERDVTADQDNNESNDSDNHVTNGLDDREAQGRENQIHSEIATYEDRSLSTGISFPGRKQYRPFFTFDQKEDRQCGKRYPGSSSHSPGLLCVQCACSNPKLIGYVIMTRAESTSLALSAMMAFFKTLPVVVLYDNACNTLAAALLRLPWFLLMVFLVVDRFHYKGHKCNALYDADIYKRLDNVKSSVAESINAKVKRSLYNMRFIKGDKLVLYLNIRFALLNLEAKYYEVTGKRDVEDVDLNKFYRSMVSCTCRVTHSVNNSRNVLDDTLSDQRSSDDHSDPMEEDTN